MKFFYRRRHFAGDAKHERKLLGLARPERLADEAEALDDFQVFLCVGGIVDVARLAGDYASAPVGRGVNNLQRLARPCEHDFLQRAEVPRETRSEEHTSELQSLAYLVCRLHLEKK